MLLCLMDFIMQGCQQTWVLAHMLDLVAFCRAGSIRSLARHLRISHKTSTSRLSASPGCVLQGWNVQPAHAPRPACGGAVLAPLFPQRLCQAAMDLGRVGAGTHPGRVGLGLQLGAGLSLG